jgi:hypothetical protein
MDDYEWQADDALMCEAKGNYGSTVFDPFDLSYLAFNICDDCMVEKAAQGRVMVTRSYKPVETDYMGIIGRVVAHRPLVPWRKGLPGDDAKLYLSPESLKKYYDDPDFQFKFPLQVVLDYVAERDAEEEARTQTKRRR